jgi:hypothetical protein
MEGTLETSRLLGVLYLFVIAETSRKISETADLNVHLLLKQAPKPAPGT